MKIRLRTGEYEISPIDLRMLQESYPKVDVPEQIKAMAAWCETNPSRRKTQRGIRRFINSWLARTQERAPKQAGQVFTAAHKPFSGNEARTSQEDKQRGLDQLARYAAMQKMVGK